MSESELRTRMNQIAEDVRVIREIVTGNGTPAKGLIVRMDRLEQDRGRKNWWSVTITTALVAAATTALAELILSIMAARGHH